MERLHAILSRTWVRRSVLGLYTSVLALTIAGYMGVSWLQLQTVAYVRGSSVLYKDRPHVVRGVIRDAPSGRLRSQVEVGFFLLEPNEGEEGAPRRSKRSAESDEVEGALLGTATPGGSGIFEASFDVPESIEPGTYDLALRAQGPTMEPFEAFRQVEVRREKDPGVTWPAKTTRISNEERRRDLESGPVRSQEGAVQIDVLPLDGELARGLTNRLYLRTYDAESGEPVAARVVFEDVEGMGRWSGEGAEHPETVETDQMGLAEVPLEPIGGQEWDLRAEPTEQLGESGGVSGGEGSNGDERERGGSVESSGTATLRLHTVPTQVSVYVGRPIVQSRRRIQGAIRSLFQSGDLLVDLYRGDDWLMASRSTLRDRRAEARLDVPQTAANDWLIRLQLARGFYDAGNNWETQYVVDSAGLEGDGIRSALERLAGWIAEHRADDAYFQHVAETDAPAWEAAGPKKREMWLRAYLSAIPRHFSRPETLISTKKRDREALASWKRDVQSKLMYAVGIGLAGGLAMLMYVVLVGVRRHRQHEKELREVDTELAAEQFDGEPYGDDNWLVAESTADNLRAGLLGLVALTTFAMFAAGIMLLLSYM